MSRDLSRDVKSVKKKSNNFYCKDCDYLAYQKSHYDKHLSSKKHQKNCQKVLKNCQKVLKKSVKKEKKFECMVCKKKYSTRQGLWYHRAKNEQCNYEKNTTGGKSVKKKKIMQSEINSKFVKDEDELIFLKNEIIELKKKEEDGELIKALIEVMKSNQEKDKALMELAKNANTTNFNNCNNKNLTVNVYLNEHCKNAMNLTDFVENLTVSIEDLLYTKNHGYIKGVSNLLTKQLNDLNPTERPIHCSDKKRLQFYVKDKDTWEKDDDHKKLDKTIHDIKIKQIKSLGIWEKENPNYMKDEKLLHEWQKLIHEIMGNENEMKQKKAVAEIKKELGATFTLKKAMKLEDKDD